MESAAKNVMQVAISAQATALRMRTARRGWGWASVEAMRAGWAATIRARSDAPERALGARLLMRGPRQTHREPISDELQISFEGGEPAAPTGGQARENRGRCRPAAVR